MRDLVAVADRIAAETGMIKSAAGATAYLVEQANKSKKPQLADGAGLAKTDPRLMFRKTMFAMARKQAGVVQRRRDTREHVALYIKAFNAWPPTTPSPNRASPPASPSPLAKLT
ncbi:MAG: hypothetical protein M3070_10965 [Actinomycetota bacterium]|nr:hypothetical protein [Actinomycetota bacterium]